MTDINASIVLYRNDPSVVWRAAASFLNAGLNGKLYLIDNSPSEFLGALSKNDSRIVYIHNKKNIGYGRAHNIAIKESINDDVPYHVVLNPDIYFKEDVIFALVEFMDKNKDVANVIPKVLYPNGEIQYLCKLLPTPLDLFSRRFLPECLLKRNMRKKFELHHSGYNKIMNVPYLSGCFMFLRTEALKKAGIFDERFFMYGEDVDLSRRLNMQFRTLYYPDVSIIHEHAQDSYKSLKMLLIHIINICRYFNKWGWFFDAQRSRANLNALRQL